MGRKLSKESRLRFCSMKYSVELNGILIRISNTYHPKSTKEMTSLKSRPANGEFRKMDVPPGKIYVAGTEVLLPLICPSSPITASSLTQMLQKPIWYKRYVIWLSEWTQLNRASLIFNSHHFFPTMVAFK